MLNSGNFFQKLKNFQSFNKYVEIRVPELVHESDNFILIEWKEQGVWLPKSKIKIQSIKNEVALRVPYALARKMDKLAK